MRTYDPQVGYIYEANNGWHLRYYVHEGGVRKQRSSKLCAKDDLHQSKTDHSVLKLAEDFMLKINQANAVNDSQPFHHCVICGYRCRRTIQGKFAPKGA